MADPVGRREWIDDLHAKIERELGAVRAAPPAARRAHLARILAYQTDLEPLDRAGAQDVRARVLALLNAWATERPPGLSPAPPRSD